MAPILVPTRSTADWKAFLAAPDRQWRAGYSAMATAQSWEAAKGLPPEIAILLGRDAKALIVIPEHKVPLPGPGRDSQCDVFAIARTTDETLAVSIEAKVDEPFGPAVGEWLTNASEAKHTRLGALCDLLGCPAPSEQLRYQLLHRTAAAIIEADRFKTDASAMIVQSFSQSHRWFEDFAAFCAFLGLDAKPNTPMRYDLPTGRTVILGWATGDRKFLTDLNSPPSLP